MKRFMTKCHLLLLCAILLLPSCRPGKQGPSLAEYGAHTQAARFARFGQYVEEISSLPLEEALARQEARLDAASADSLSWQEEMEAQDRFFADPNSPWRSEELFLPVAQRMAVSPWSTGEQRSHARWMLPRLALNRLGTVAADFPFLLPGGRATTLHDVIDSRRPQRTLLFFSNPGCHNCKEITEALSADEAACEAIAAGKLLVVNIYPDEDVQAWLDYLPNYPSSWVCGHDSEGLLLGDTIYWLRAIPSLYLLDEEKRVVLKDAPMENVLIALGVDR